MADSPPPPRGNPPRTRPNDVSAALVLAVTALIIELRRQNVLDGEGLRKRLAEFAEDSEKDSPQVAALLRLFETFAKTRMP